jgi:hypothetical protein
VPWRAGVVLAILAASASAGAAERAIQVAGYFGTYDPATVPVWPERLQLLMGSVRREGALVAAARERARAADNPARFFFYLSLSSLDGGCGCYDAELLARVQREHPEWVLKDERGEPISTYLQVLPRGRQLALDVGNRAYLDLWADVVLENARRWGWDGVFADNVLWYFGDNWSAAPVNPRTGRRYSQAEYRADTLAAVKHLRARFDAAHKEFIGNHGSGWEFFDKEPLVAKQILAQHGVAVEDFAYSFSGPPLREADWIRQLEYMEFANRHGVMTYAHGGKDAFMDPARREFVLASYLLTRRGRSVVGDLNAEKTWWPALATDLGAAAGAFYCLDPRAGFRRATPCPAPGQLVARDFARATVVVNPGDAAVTMPLGGPPRRFLDGAPAPASLALAPHTGRVLVHADQTASRTSSGRPGR